MCLRQNSGNDNATHALRQRFHKDPTKEIVLIDVRNAFNGLNRDLAPRNIKNFCPLVYTAITKFTQT